MPGGQSPRLTRLSAHGVPTIALVFGNSTAGGAYVPGMCDYVVMIDQRSKVFLGGPPLVKMATGEESDDESLGGADMHARVSGLADYFAVDEAGPLRIGQLVVRRLNHRKRGPGPRGEGRPPPATTPTRCSESRRPTCGCRSPAVTCSPASSTTATSTSSSPLRQCSSSRAGPSCTGIRSACSPTTAGSSSTESHKGEQFIQLANQSDTPLLFLQNTTGYMVGKEYEQKGMVKDGSKMINAVSNSRCPPHGQHGRQLRRRQLRDVRAGLRTALLVHLAECEDRGDGPAGSPACCPSSPASRPRRWAAVRRGGRRRDAGAVED